MTLAETDMQPRPQDVESARMDAAPKPPGFCVGIDLFIAHKQMTSSWVLDIIDGWASYFVSEWPSFRLEALEYSALHGARAVLLAEFATSEISQMELRRAQMWWQGIPVFGMRGHTTIIDRGCYDSRVAARAALVPIAEDYERRVA